MSTLHDRLVDLASDAPPPAPDPLLWERAARFHRRRRATAVAGVAVVVLAVLSLVGIETWQRSPGVEPAAPGAEPALPARFYSPSPWLPGTGGEPTGPLAAVMTAERKGWFSTDDGVVGVSATTGEYRFLDLPDDSGREWALSPDGRRVAYWVTGDTRMSPYTAGGQYLPATGVAVWDAETGEVRRHQVASDHGLMTLDLQWADPERLVVRWATYRSGDTDGDARLQGGGTDRVGLRVWDVSGSAGPVPLGVDADVDGGNGRGQVLVGGRRSVLDVGSGRRAEPGSAARYGGVTALSADGSAIAYPRGNRNPGPLTVVRSGAGEPVVVLDDDVWAAVAWLDDDTIAFVTRDADQDPIPAAIETLSLSTGERKVLIDAGPDLQPGFDDLATDLLVVEPRDYPAPPLPWDPRAVLGWTLAAVGVAGLYLWGRWRRVAV